MEKQRTASAKNYRNKTKSKKKTSDKSINFNKRFGAIDKLEILMMQQEERLKKIIFEAVSQGVESIRVYNESIKSDIRAIAEGHAHHSTRIDDHEKRITTLENRHS